MNKEVLKLEPYLGYTYRNTGYKIKCSGRGDYAPWYTITRGVSKIDDLELILMSYLNHIGYRDDINESPIKKYLPYLYDDDYFGIIDRNWNTFNVVIEAYNEDGSYVVMSPPEFEKIFDSLEEFEQYIGEKVPVKFNDGETTIWRFEEEWKDSHNFAVVNNKVDEYDLEKSSVIRRAIYTINNKYYELFYIENFYCGASLWQEPTEVVPIKKTVTITEYVEKR